MSDYKHGVVPLKPQKERVKLQERKFPTFKPPKPVWEPPGNSRGLVSHIWQEWACKNYDV